MVQHADASAPSSEAVQPPLERDAKRRRLEEAQASGADETGGAAEDCTSFEEFRSTLGYFFTLFRKTFPAELEQTTKDQFDAMEDGDLTVRDDGGNNPEVTMRLDPVYMAKLCDALEDADGTLPSIHVPRTPEQVSFWRSRARQDTAGSAPEGDEAAVGLSEAASHWETLREALAWCAATSEGDTAVPLRVFILGASARYEYGGLEADGTFCAQRAAERLVSGLVGAARAAASGRDVEFLLCGRDVPAELDGSEYQGAIGPVEGSNKLRVKHRVGYLHDLAESDAGVEKVRGALFVALHGGLGLDHPELAGSWPPTLQLLRLAAPAWLAVSSFNQVEHDIATEKLNTLLPGQVQVDRTGVNSVGSLEGPDAIGPFDGIQGKRNYCVLHARVMPLTTSNDGWDLFE